MNSSTWLSGGSPFKPCLPWMIPSTGLSRDGVPWMNSSTWLYWMWGQLGSSPLLRALPLMSVLKTQSTFIQWHIALHCVAVQCSAVFPMRNLSVTCLEHTVSSESPHLAALGLLPGQPSVSDPLSAFDGCFLVHRLGSSDPGVYSLRSSCSSCSCSLRCSFSGSGSLRCSCSFPWYEMSVFSSSCSVWM